MMTIIVIIMIIIASSVAAVAVISMANNYHNHNKHDDHRGHYKNYHDHRNYHNHTCGRIQCRFVCRALRSGHVFSWCYRIQCFLSWSRAVYEHTLESKQAQSTWLKGCVMQGQDSQRQVCHYKLPREGNLKYHHWLSCHYVWLTF